MWIGGDNSPLDTITGSFFFTDDPNVFENWYLGSHIYQDTGIYEITYKDSFWVDGITNIPNSSMQPFILKTKVLLGPPGLLGSNLSVSFSSPLDAVFTSENGVVKHFPLLVDLGSSDSISAKLIPAPVPGYFLPEATDSIACCIIWDKPMETGRFVFGMEATDWREAMTWMGTVQRFILVEVDSIHTLASQEKHHGKGMVVSPNPVNAKVNIQFLNPYILGQDYTLGIVNVFGEEVLQKGVTFIEYAAGMGLDVGHLPAGLYFLTLEAGGHLWVEKLVVQ